MRTLLTSYIALILSQTALSSSTTQTGPEEGLALHPCAFPFISSGAQYAIRALDQYNNGHYAGAVTSWQAALTQGYNFFLSDQEHVLPYTEALRLINLPDKACVTWKWYFSQPDALQAPVFYKHYADCALDAADYAQTLQSLEKYRELGGLEDTHTLFLAS